MCQMVIEILLDIYCNPTFNELVGFQCRAVENSKLFTDPDMIALLLFIVPVGRGVGLLGVVEYD